MISNLFIYFLCFVLSTVGLVIVGAVVIVGIPAFNNLKASFTYIFLAYLFGMIVVALSFALYLTGGKTILILLFPIFFYLVRSVIKNGKHIDIPWKYSMGHLVMTCATFIVF